MQKAEGRRQKVEGRKQRQDGRIFLFSFSLLPFAFVDILALSAGRV
jgi:hypothetical protein